MAPKAAFTYVEPAPLTDVLLEQLEFLLTHTTQEACSLSCPACARLLEVQAVLLAPFRP